MINSFFYNSYIRVDDIFDPNKSNIKKESLVVSNKHACDKLFITYKKSSVSIDYGFLFDSPVLMENIKISNYVPDQVPNTREILGHNIIYNVEIDADHFKSITFVRFMKIQEALSSIGGIISIIKIIFGLIFLGINKFGFVFKLFSDVYLNGDKQILYNSKNKQNALVSPSSKVKMGMRKLKTFRLYEKNNHKYRNKLDIDYPTKIINAREIENSENSPNNNRKRSIDKKFDASKNTKKRKTINIDNITFHELGNNKAFINNNQLQKDSINSTPGKFNTYLRSESDQLGGSCRFDSRENSDFPDNKRTENISKCEMRGRTEETRNKKIEMKNDNKFLEYSIVVQAPINKDNASDDLNGLNNSNNKNSVHKNNYFQDESQINSNMCTKKISKNPLNNLDESHNQKGLQSNDPELKILKTNSIKINNVKFKLSCSTFSYAFCFRRKKILDPLYLILDKINKELDIKSYIRLKEDIHIIKDLLIDQKDLDMFNKPLEFQEIYDIIRQNSCNYEGLNNYIKKSFGELLKVKKKKVFENKALKDLERQFDIYKRKYNNNISYDE